MKLHLVCLLTALGLEYDRALAQEAGGITEKMRACSLLAQPALLQCLEKLSAEIAPSKSANSPRKETPPTTRWIVSETTSPIDYRPVVLATSGADGAEIQLSIRCRGGRTDLVVLGSRLTGRAEEYTTSYQVDDGRPVVLATVPVPTGRGIMVKGDAARLLASLPKQGEVTIQVSASQHGTLKARYNLADVSVMLERLAVPCGWPARTTP